jgi:hypothetical protein
MLRPCDLGQNGIEGDVAVDEQLKPVPAQKLLPRNRS